MPHGSSRSPRRWRTLVHRMPTPRASVAGGASLGRARPLASLVALVGTAAFGFEPSGSFLHRSRGLRRSTGQSTSENRAPTSCRGLGKHEAWAGRVSSCRAELRLRALRETEDTGVTPQAPPLAPVRDAPSRQKPPHGDPLAHSREHAIRHPRVGAFVTRSVGGPRKSCFAAAERRSTNRRYVRPMSAQSLE